jgi:taurine dioxygenase
MEIRTLDGAGAEITGVDLRAATDEQVAAIRDAFARHGLVFFRDQILSETDHLALAERFGPVNVNRFFAAHPEHPQIALVTKEPDQSANIGGGWHTDHSYDHEPALGSILVARELPEHGGDTWFASMYAAYETLSDGLKATLRGLRAVHSAKHVFGTGAAYRTEADTGARLGNASAADALEDPVHPVVIRHPLSGRPALYVNPAFTIRFEGWTAEESRPLLDFLYAHAARDAHVHRFAWRPGSVAFWDNRATWHFAQNDYAGQRREMHRITIEGGPLEAA